MFGLLVVIGLASAGLYSFKLDFVGRFVCLGLVKRDTLSDSLTDIGDSLKDAVGLNNDKGIMGDIEDLDVSYSNPHFHFYHLFFLERKILRFR